MQSARQRILPVAMRLFAEQGFQATGVAEIQKAADARSGSFYFAFPSKDDLLVAVLEAYRDGIEPMLLAPAWEGVDDPIERVFALLAAYRRLLVESGCLYGCPIGSIALELRDPPEAVRRLLSINFDGWVGHVEACFEAAAARLPAQIDRRALAVFVLTTMEGGVMLARTHRSPEAFDAAVAMLRDYVDRLLKPEESR